MSVGGADPRPEAGPDPELGSGVGGGVRKKCCNMCMFGLSEKNFVTMGAWTGLRKNSRSTMGAWDGLRNFFVGPSSP